MCAVTNAFTFMYIETKCSQRDYKKIVHRLHVHAK